MGRTGVKPHIHDVGVLGPLGSATLLADFACGDNLLGLVLVPGIRALLAEQVADRLDGSIRDVVGAALLAVEGRDGHAPGTLTADAPVVAVAHHAGHAVMAPVGHPGDRVDGLVHVLAELGDGAEPLLGGTEDDGVMAAPAVRVLMLDVQLAHHGTGSGQVGQDGLVGCPDTLTCVLAGQVGQVAAIVHGDGDGHLGVLLADVEVVHAVAACGMNAAGTAFQRDVVAQDDPAFLGQIDVVVTHELELSAADRLAHDLVVLDVAGVHDALDQIGGHDVVLLADLDEGVLKLAVEADGLVGGQSPGGGGPDHKVGLVHRDAVLCQHTVGVLRDMETDEDGIAVVLTVLDLSLSQSGTAVRAPVHGLQALVDVALLGHLAKDLDLACLKLRLQGQVGVLEITDDAQTLELVAHDVDVLGGKLFADLAQLQLGDVLLLVADGGQGLQLDGQAVGIKTGHIGSLIALHVLVTDDDILDDLVQGGAHVDVAVCIRRAVMQDELRLALVVLHELIVQVVVVPILEHDRLLFGQTGTHLKQGLGQIQGTVVLRFVLSQWLHSPLYLLMDTRLTR